MACEMSGMQPEAPFTYSRANDAPQHRETVASDSPQPARSGKSLASMSVKPRRLPIRFQHLFRDFLGLYNVRTALDHLAQFLHLLRPDIVGFRHVVFHSSHFRITLGKLHPIGALNRCVLGRGAPCIRADICFLKLLALLCAVCSYIANSHDNPLHGPL